MALLQDDCWRKRDITFNKVASGRRPHVVTIERGRDMTGNQGHFATLQTGAHHPCPC